nr:MBOAT family protein [Roseomonas acroporae]
MFPTGLFALFFVLVFAGHWLLHRHRTADRLFLIGASLIFFGAWDWRFCFLLVFSALWSWAIGLAIAAAPPGSRARRWRTGMGVAVHLALLGYFKYADFFLAQLGELLLRFDIPPPALLGVVLPVGISFFTFQGISYVVDVARGDAAPERSPLNVVTYITFFPHLAAGPIVRAAHFLPQLHAAPDPRRIPLIMAGLLILGGLIKKSLISDSLATHLVEPVFRDPTSVSAADALLGIYGYAVQIYCDFSGYSDIAIGVAALLGYHFPRNFDQPYRAASLSEFWRRWHISLSSWLRDYLYIPLGGSRHGERATQRNLLLTMTLGGLWHGAAWRFLFWGLLHGLWLAAERVLGLRRPPGSPLARTEGSPPRQDRAPPHRPWRRVLGILVTFHVVCLGWVLFRAPDLETAGDVLAALGRWGDEAQYASLPLLALVAFALALHFLPGDWNQRLERALSVLPAPVLGLALGAAVVVTLTLGPPGVAPFIYFQF